MLVTVNSRLKFEIEIVHDLSCHPIVSNSMLSRLKMVEGKKEGIGRGGCLLKPMFWVVLTGVFMGVQSGVRRL